VWYLRGARLRGDGCPRNELMVLPLKTQRIAAHKHDYDLLGA
jgi:hypothetical protein